MLDKHNMIFFTILIKYNFILKSSSLSVRLFNKMIVRRLYTRLIPNNICFVLSLTGFHVCYKFVNNLLRHRNSMDNRLVESHNKGFRHLAHTSISSNIFFSAQLEQQEVQQRPAFQSMQQVTSNVGNRQSNR